MLAKRGRKASHHKEPSPKRVKYEDAEEVFQSMEQLSSLQDRPESFIQATPALQNQLLSLLQTIYLYGKKTEPRTLTPLSKLIVDSMDSEQIWAQLQLLNKPLMKYVDQIAEQAAGDSEEESSDLDSDDEASEAQEDSDLDQPMGDEEDMISTDQESDDDAPVDEEADDQDSSELEDDQVGEEALEDDPFFDLDEMEAFIAEDERRAEMGSEGEDEELLDYLNRDDLSDDDSEEDGGIDWDRMKNGSDDEPAQDPRYEDFYEEPEKMTQYQKSKVGMQERIQALEEQNIADKPWQLKGEVSGKSRPQDSLLEEFVIFDHATKTAPEVTVESTKSLEDLIKRRIQEESWDDVIPRRTEAETEKRRELKELDHEKSKHGLAEVYERQYLGLDKDEAERRAKATYDEITALFTSLSHKLDALSNFHYTPRMIKTAPTEKKDVAAIEMEEATPSGVSDAAMLAPEEVYAPKRKPVKGTSEFTSEEKKARRRAAKTAMRKQKKAEEADRKVVERLNPGMGNKYTKQAALDNLKELRRSKNVQFAGKSDTMNYTQSSAFFSKLQQDAQNEIGKLKGDQKKAQSEPKTDVTGLKM